MKQLAEPFETGAQVRAGLIPVSGGLDDVYDPDLVGLAPDALSEKIKLREDKTSTRDLMRGPVAGAGGGNGSGKRQVKFKALGLFCINCQTRRAADEVVCMLCGAIIGQREFGPVRHARIPAEYGAFFRNSDLQLRDLLVFLTSTEAWKAGRLTQWAQTYGEGRQTQRPNGGRPCIFGEQPSAKIQGRLQPWLEFRLTQGGLSFAPGAELHLSAATLMGFDLYTEALRLFKGRVGPVALMRSDTAECEELTDQLCRPDVDAITLALLQRPRDALACSL